MLPLDGGPVRMCPPCYIGLLAYRRAYDDAYAAGRPTADISAAYNRLRVYADDCLKCAVQWCWCCFPLE